MKKVLPVILVLVLLMTATVALVACSEQTPTIERYYVEYPSDGKNMKDSYSFKSGETFSNTSIKIVCVLSDKSEKYLPMDKSDVTKVVYSDEMKALLDKKNKFIDVSEVKTVYLTVTFLDVEPFNVKITVRPKG